MNTNLKTVVTQSAICKGFTVFEMLVAGSVGLISICVAGQALLSSLSSTNVAQSKTVLSAENHRAADFIASEIRQADWVFLDASDISKRPSDFDPEAATGVTQARPVLMLEDNQTNSVPIVYYLASPQNGIWEGPKVIYRWGPRFDASGKYVDPDDPSQWSYQPLVDQVAETGAVLTCQRDWVHNGTGGFNICVHPSGRLVEIAQRLETSPIAGRKVSYRKTFTATTRTQQSVAPFPPVVGGSPPGGGGPTPSLTPTCFLVMDEDSIDNDIAAIDNAARDNGVDPDALINKNAPTESGNPPLLWNQRYSGGTVTLPIGQSGDEGVFSLPPRLEGKNGQFSREDFISGTVPQADLDEVKDVQPLDYSTLQSFVGQSCVAIVYDSDVSVNYGPLQANLQGARLGRFYLTITSVTRTGMAVTVNPA